MSEALILQTYPLKEADLVVSFLARDQGKLRGVAKRARRPGSPFGSGLQRLSHVKLSYFQREHRELVNVDAVELLQSQFGLLGDYSATVALDYFAEVSEQLLPAAEPNERYFRLLLAVLEHLRGGAPGAVWRAVTYFSLWAVRLSGLLPDLSVCLGCGTWLADPETPQRAFFTRGRPGLMCDHCRRTQAPGASWELSAASRAIAAEMLRKPVGEAEPAAWPQETAADLRRFLVQQIEAHIERRLRTAEVLEQTE